MEIEAWCLHRSAGKIDIVLTCAPADCCRRVLIVDVAECVSAVDVCAVKDSRVSGA